MTGRIGELLIADGLLAENAVRRALGFQRLSGERVKLGSIPLNWELLGEEELLNALSKLHRCPAVPWSVHGAAEIGTVRLLSSSQAIRLGAVVYGSESGWIRVAFGNPGDLAAVDEVAAITGRRVAPGVTTEARLLQAHQRFYGRHLPLHFRAIVQKLDRKRAEPPRPAGWPEEIDFRTPDVRRMPKTRDGSGSSSSAARFDENVFDQSAGEFHFPEIPLPQIPATREPAPLESAPRQIDIVGGEDSFSRWVADALAAFRGEKRAQEPQVRGVDALAEDVAAFGPAAGADTGPMDRDLSERDSTPAVEAEADGSGDPVADMWRPSHEQELSEAVASRMWTAGEESTESDGADARTRERIARSILESFLTEFPRVLLFGAEKQSIVGWGARGPNLTSDRVVALRIARSERSLFPAVQAGSPHYGSVPAGEWPDCLSALLGSPAPPCAVFPIRMLDEVAGFLYADRLGEPMRHDDFPVLARAAAAAMGVFSRFLVQSDSAAPV